MLTICKICVLSKLIDWSIWQNCQHLFVFTVFQNATIPFSFRSLFKLYNMLYEAHISIYLFHHNIFIFLQPTLSYTVYILTGIVGVLTHYLLPQLRKQLPWLFVSSPVLKSYEYNLYEWQGLYELILLCLILQSLSLLCFFFFDLFSLNYWLFDEILNNA